MSEEFILYDRNRIPTGTKIARGEKIPEGSYHLVVHLFVTDSSGRILIQRRRDSKETFPGRWDIAMGGSSVGEESSLEAVKRETREELGLVIEGEPLPALTVFYSEGFDDYYVLKSDLDPGKLRLQEEEVSRVRWASMDEVLSLIDSGRFIPYRRELIQLLRQMGSGDGAFFDIPPQFGVEKEDGNG